MAYLTVSEMRQAIKKVYPSDSWSKKVSKMYDTQIIAIYYRFLEDGKFDRKPVKKEPLNWFDRNYKENKALQMSFEYLM